MCAGNEKEIELVRKELFKAGIASETRRHPIAQALGVGGVELWVQNERDFFHASRLCTGLKQKVANSPLETATSPKPETSGGSTSEPKPKKEPASTPSNDAGKVESTATPAAEPRRLELKQASSLLQKGIEEILSRESELNGKCASLQGKVEELTSTLALAQADVAREIQSREAAARDQAEQLNSLLETLARERREWQEKLKSSEDAIKNTKEQAGSLSRQLQTQQAAVAALKQQVAGLELQRDEQERCLSDVRNETVAERKARVAAEERAASAEESLQRQCAERQELERQIQAHAASIGSLLGRMAPKTAAATGAR